MLDGLSLAVFDPLFEVLEKRTASAPRPSAFGYSHHFQIKDSLRCRDLACNPRENLWLPESRQFEGEESALAKQIVMSVSSTSTVWPKRRRLRPQKK